jgi:DNA-binding NarL/FixJ family response regulator
MKDLRVLILDDEMVIARDLERILLGIGLKKLKIANSSEEALRQARRFLPHLLLSDINLEETRIDGITVTDRITSFLQVKIIYITAHTDQSVFDRARQSRPENYIVKPFEDEQVRVAVELALSSPAIEKCGVLKPEKISSLTDAEKRILHYVAQNMTTKQIAKRLFISPKTVENHRSNVSRKLGLKPRNNSLLAWAIEHKELL